MNFSMNVKVKVRCNICGTRLDVAQALTNDDGLSFVVDPCKNCLHTYKTDEEKNICQECGADDWAIGEDDKVITCAMCGHPANMRAVVRH